MSPQSRRRCPKAGAGGEAGEQDGRVGASGALETEGAGIPKVVPARGPLASPSPCSSLGLRRQGPSQQRALLYLHAGLVSGKVIPWAPRGCPGRFCSWGDPIPPPTPGAVLRPRRPHLPGRPTCSLSGAQRACHRTCPWRWHALTVPAGTVPRLWGRGDRQASTRPSRMKRNAKRAGRVCRWRRGPCGRTPSTGHPGQRPGEAPDARWPIHPLTSATVAGG